MLLLTLALPARVLAFEHWNLAVEKDLKTIIVYNKTSQPQTLWVSGPIKSLPSNPEEKLEQALRIDAFGSLEIASITFKQHPWIHLKAENKNSLQLTVFDENQKETLLTSGSSHRWMSKTTTRGDLILVNLAPFAQKIRFFDSSENPDHSASVVLEAFEKQRLELPSWGSGRSLIVEGEARLHAYIASPQKPQSFRPSLDPGFSRPAPDKTYFRLSNRDDSQSYIVGLVDAELIEQARIQIKQPLGSPGPWIARILIAEIDYGSAGENRDWSKPGKPLWSWHVRRAINFAQLAHQDCDGSPEMLEELLSPWKQGSGIICFWNYRVVEELSHSEVSKPTTKPPGRASPRP